MNNLFIWKHWCCGALLALGCARAAASDGPRDVSFAKDIRPLLDQNCFACHGEKKQKAGLRLDRRVGFFSPTDNGKLAAVAGKPDESEMYTRALSRDDDKRMPPDGERLSDTQLTLLKTWIEGGAQIPDDGSGNVKHWAYVKPRVAALPEVNSSGWCRSGIDWFILQRLEKEKLAPSPEAPRAELLRRVSLDLAGLPPTFAEADAFINDASPDAYEKVVDRLLASSAYGERWARPWLDLARYADTQGYEKDNRRSMWSYRDWVIDALNRDLTFDQFSIEQIAGDMLPNATQAQRVASGFHRNTMTNTEGGTDHEEFRYEAVVDRVNTTFGVWMGTTMACAQCHNHKYDPFATKEYYQALAFLNSTEDSNKEDERPTLKVFGAGQQEQLEKLRADEKAAAKKFEDAFSAPEQIAALAEWEKHPGKIPDDLAKVLAIAQDKRNAQQRARIRKQFSAQTPLLKNLEEAAAAAKKQTDDFDNLIGKSSVMVELAKPRVTQRHVRGAYMSTAEEVKPGTPAVLHPFPTDQPLNRLGFARWLVSRENPLTARVIVNRFWEQYFGRGIVETVEEFGKQGEAPTHPELLDWLAVQFMNGAQSPLMTAASPKPAPWSMKALHRLIVTSAAYRQSSVVTMEGREKDLFNRLLARGPRVRLEAEMIRDQALAVSGLLSKKIGGPSVMPPQPDGLWQMVYSGDQWKTSSGEDKYRRGLYTFWRRSSPHPMMVSFDAPSREFCVLKRNRSDTPLQALNVLNDPEFVECAQALARRITASPGDNNARAAFALRTCLTRNAKPAEIERLVKLYESERETFAKDPKAAEKMAASELGKAAEGANVPELAAWTVVANVLLNLDEMITK